MKIQTEFKSSQLVLDKGYDAGIQSFGDGYIAFYPRHHGGMLGKTKEEALEKMYEAIKKENEKNNP